MTFEPIEPFSTALTQCPGDARVPTKSHHQRLFFALWPNDKLREQLHVLGQRSFSGSGRPVKRENLHITLIFLGTVDDTRRACAENAAASVKTPPFRLELDKVGCWPRARVLWAGASREPAALLSLVQQLTACLEGCGFQPEERPYRAHVTLVRKVARRVQPSSHSPIVWSTKDFHLVESRTCPEGVQYRVVASWPLRESADDR